jgi:hypothetical protein
MLLLLVARMSTSNRPALVSERNSSLERVSGVELEIERRGRGRPLLVLYGEEALELDAPVSAGRNDRTGSSRRTTSAISISTSWSA